MEWQAVLPKGLRGSVPFIRFHTLPMRLDFPGGSALASTNAARHVTLWDAETWSATCRSTVCPELCL
jgi:hypothetical protein